MTPSQRRRAGSMFGRSRGAGLAGDAQDSDDAVILDLTTPDDDNDDTTMASVVDVDADKLDTKDSGEKASATVPTQSTSHGPPAAAAQPRTVPTVMTVQEAAQQPGFVAGMTITILATLLLTFCADLLVVGHIRHARDQQTSFADLRGYLAAGTAAVNQTQDDGALVPLGTPIGVLEIPQIGLREVFFEGTTAGVLMSGPGHRRDSPLPGQAGSSVIMGRKAAYGGPFSYLEQLSVGQVFTVVTGQGRQYFRVSGIRHSGKGSPPVVGLGESRLMLVTASGGDYQPNGAVYVDATFVGWTAVDGTADKAPLTNAVLESGPRPLSAVDLPIAERPLRGDDGALPAILLWSVLLAAGALVTAWLRLRWGKWQVWLAGAPPLLAAGLTLSDQLARLLPNLM